MQEKSILLTPNKRLSRHLQKQFCQAASLQNKITWYGAKILPLNAWLIDCWQRSLDPRVLLSSFQEKLLWQKTIAENLDDNFNNFAEQAINFHELINGWQIENLDFTTYETEEILIFRSLYKKFINYCKNKNLVTISELPTLIVPYIENLLQSEPILDSSNLDDSLNHFSLSKQIPMTITFAGFDEYSPQLQTLIDAIESVGCKVSKIDPNKYENSIQKLLGFEHLNQEITTAALWAKQIVNDHPKTRIGVIVPNLVKLSYKITQIFTQVLGNNKSINISAGIPLSTIPIINNALELLSLHEPFDSKSISNLLLSPYIHGSKIENSQRSLLNYQLQQSEYLQLTLTDLKQLIGKYKKNVPLLLQSLKKWQELFLSIQNKTFHNSQWMQIIATILQILGWPGENNLTNLESNAINHFIKTLQTVTTTDLITSKTSYKKALQILKEHILTTVLPSEPQTDTPINIVGILEAGGINFDHLWVMGLDEESWPTMPKPNPFIPVALQRKLFLPHSSAQRELHFCKTLIERYKRSAKEAIIFSYVKQIEDRIVAPSPIIVDIPEVPVEALNLTNFISWQEKIYNTQKLEPMINYHAPKLMADEITHAPSHLIELQSLCPFRAFVEFRLKTPELKKPTLGISKINRGILVHSALEYFWQKVKTKKTLCTLNSIELQKLIHASIERSLNKLTLSSHLYELEKQCLIPLLTKLLEIEKERYPFTVTATEKSVEITLSSIPIKLRIDRIDQLDDGKILLLDYKTGKNLPSVFDWFGPRPKNIQLMLYSLTIDSIEGLALVQINTEAIKFKNISLEELAFGLHTKDPNNNLNNTLTWNELIKYWHDILSKIAYDFASGKASVTPSSPQVCKQCGFDSVCRIIH